jgi:hypothetical protein
MSGNYRKLSITNMWKTLIDSRMDCGVLEVAAMSERKDPFLTLPISLGHQ